MPRHRIGRNWSSVLALVLALAAGLWVWRDWSVPASVRKLPQGDALVYLDLDPIRSAGLLEAPGKVAPAYAGFVRESGFDLSRDLDQVALSMQGSPLAPSQSTAVLSGRFGAGFEAYLAHHALRTVRLGRRTGYQFAGWARPAQSLTLVQLDARHWLVTNAADPGAMLPGWLPGLFRSPRPWQRPFWSLPPIAYAASSDLPLPDGGAAALKASVGPSAGGGLNLDGALAADSPAAAAAALAWLQTERQQLEPLLNAQRHDDGIDLGVLLGRVQLGLDGRQVTIHLQLDRATLGQWRAALAADRSHDSKRP